ncbi:hypothetical protein NQ315_001278 [Exocentrus adspersus]|uniref:AIP/AIPL N-terminal FKBP-type PPIase domain-containing protein n=1 Tax=Exocentrus adspersus TaxID=1586481 RepID=A0AAV8WEU9_9CUCU|nr:hypothetical protein NQ315_001278 [Exocentrus adspersus]
MLFVLIFTAAAAANLYEECAKLYHPNNYLNYLPNLNLPYLGNVPIPVNPPVQPTPVVTTKAVSIVTKYVYRNPVCVKYSKRQSGCKQDNGAKHKSNVEQLVTKEYFVKNREGSSSRADDYDEFRFQRSQDPAQEYNDLEEESEDYFVQGSEEPRPFSMGGGKPTPHLTKKQVHELLIEDRLDQLESILPHYTRRRAFETSTVTVTKVLSNKRSMATLIVKNCVPQGYELCAPKRKKRRSKVARPTVNFNETRYFEINDMDSDKELITKKNCARRDEIRSFQRWDKGEQRNYRFLCYFTIKTCPQIHFHFQTRQCNAEKTLLDDSREMGQGKPLDLVLGKKFKLEVWEAILQKMAVNEVAQFTVDKSLVMQYPFVSKTLRDLHRPKSERKSHCCAMTLQNEGVGYDDLNQFLKHPTDLEFTMEVLKVEQPDSYEKESWQLEEEEKIKMIPQLKEQGNLEYKNKNYEKAAELYAKAIGMLEQLMLKEKPHDVEWNELNSQKNPILLNYAQCKLYQGDYYSVIEHCGTVLKTDKDNVKAYFRRAKAHVKVWNVEEARNDFNKVMELDESLTALVKKELAELEKQVKEKDMEDKGRFSKLFV